MCNKLVFRIGNVEGKVWKYPFSRTTLLFGAPVCIFAQMLYFGNYTHTPSFSSLIVWTCASIFIRFLWRARKSNVRSKTASVVVKDLRFKDKDLKIGPRGSSRTNFQVLVLAPCPRTTSPCPRPRKFKSSKIFEDWVGYLCQHLVLG